MPITNHFSLVFRILVGAMFAAWVVAMAAQPPSLYPMADQMGVGGHWLSGGLGFLMIPLLSAKSTHHSLDKALSSGFFMLVMAALVAFLCVKMWGNLLQQAQVHLNPSNMASQETLQDLNSCQKEALRSLVAKSFSTDHPATPLNAHVVSAKAAY